MAENEYLQDNRHLTISSEADEVYVAGKPVRLTKGQLHLLRFLTEHQGETFSRKQLIEAVQGPDYPATDRSIDTQIVGLRKKLGSLAGSIEAVRGVGYRFEYRDE